MAERYPIQEAPVNHDCLSQLLPLSHLHFQPFFHHTVPRRLREEGHTHGLEGVQSPRMSQRHLCVGSGPAKAAAGLRDEQVWGTLWWEAQPAAGKMLQGRQEEKGVGRLEVAVDSKYFL